MEKTNTMNTDAETRALAVVDRMRLAWHALDREAILALFADDARIEDPVGGPKIPRQIRRPARGRDLRGGG